MEVRVFTVTSTSVVTCGSFFKTTAISSVRILDTPILTTPSRFYNLLTPSSPIHLVYFIRLYRYQKADLDVVLFTDLPPSRQSYSSTRLRRCPSTLAPPSANTFTYRFINTSNLS